MDREKQDGGGKEDKYWKLLSSQLRLQDKNNVDGNNSSLVLSLVKRKEQVGLETFHVVAQNPWEAPRSRWQRQELRPTRWLTNHKAVPKHTFKCLSVNNSTTTWIGLSIIKHAFQGWLVHFVNLAWDPLQQIIVLLIALSRLKNKRYIKLMQPGQKLFKGSKIPLCASKTRHLLVQAPVWAFFTHSMLLPTAGLDVHSEHCRDSSSCLPPLVRLPHCFNVAVQVKWPGLL